MLIKLSLLCYYERYLLQYQTSDEYTYQDYYTYTNLHARMNHEEDDSRARQIRTSYNRIIFRPLQY